MKNNLIKKIGRKLVSSFLIGSLLVGCAPKQYITKDVQFYENPFDPFIQSWRIKEVNGDTITKYFYNYNAFYLTKEGHYPAKKIKSTDNKKSFVTKINCSENPKELIKANKRIDYFYLIKDSLEQTR